MELESLKRNRQRYRTVSVPVFSLKKDFRYQNGGTCARGSSRTAEKLARVHFPARKDGNQDKLSQISVRELLVADSITYFSQYIRLTQRLWSNQGVESVNHGFDFSNGAIVVLGTIFVFPRIQELRGNTYVTSWILANKTRIHQFSEAIPVSMKAILMLGRRIQC